PTLAGAGIRVSALTADGEAAAVPDALVATDLDLAANVALDLAAEVTFDLVVGLDPVAELDQLRVAEILDAEVRADAGALERLERACPADAEDVREGDFQALVAREVDADEACHGFCCSPSPVSVPSRAAAGNRAEVS